MKRRTIMISSLGAGFFVLVAGLTLSSSPRGRRFVGMATGDTFPANVFEGVDFIAHVTHGPKPAGAGHQDVIPGRYVVKFDRRAVGAVSLSGSRLNAREPALAAAITQAGLHDVRQAFRATPTRLLGASRGLTATYDVASDLPLEEVRAALETRADVEWVEPATFGRLHGAPDDTFYVYQWHMTGLRLPELLDIEDGTGAVVAVIDSGVSNGSDAYQSYGEGYDFADADDDASDPDGAIAGVSHGTHVAGTIAQSTNNGSGTAGLAPGATIMPLRVCAFSEQADGVTCPNTDIASAIVWAADHGADVINMSLGGANYSQVLADACAYAWEAGVVIVASSGNDGYTDAISYPGGYANVIAVGATGLDDDIAYYSNQGAGLDLVAPGGDLTQDDDDDGYGDGVLQETYDADGWSFQFLQGTSMAAPHVAAAAALLVAHGWTDPAEIEEALLSTADDLGADGRDDVFGRGILDPMGALALPVPDGPPDEPSEDSEDDSEDEEKGSVRLEMSEVATDHASGGRANIT